MYQSLDLFQIAQSMARHAGARQALTAQNVANADTPDYQARHLPSFSDVWQDHAPDGLRQTRAGHLGAAPGALNARMTDALSEPAPNGNAVSVEEEMVNAVNISREHNRALAIYRHGMTVIRTALGN